MTSMMEAVWGKIEINMVYDYDNVRSYECFFELESLPGKFQSNYGRII